MPYIRLERLETSQTANLFEACLDSQHKAFVKNDHLNNGDLTDYASEKAQQIFGMTNPNAKPKLTVSRGIGLARRPDKLSSRIQLKSLPAPDDLPRGPIIEELD
jgi:hypothetical protein